MKILLSSKSVITIYLFLNHISTVLGTPTEETWPRVSQLPEYKSDYAIYKRIPLESLLPKLDPSGIDLLSQLIEYQPEKRISAEDALQHPYFEEIRKKEQSSQASSSSI